MLLRQLTTRAPRAAAARELGSWTSRPHKDGNYKMNGAKMMFVVRHAERHDRSTPDGWSELALRPQDTPLSQRGLRQSRRLGKWFYGKLPIHRPLAIFATPFIRCIQTADAIAVELEGLQRAAEQLRPRALGLNPAEGHPHRTARETRHNTHPRRVSCGPSRPFRRVGRSLLRVWCAEDDVAP